MKWDWRNIAHLAAGVTGMLIPGAVQIEQGIEGAIDAKTGPEKADAVVSSALGSLEAAAAISGKNYATPRVEAAIKRLNDDGVELLNALSEAHAA